MPVIRELREAPGAKGDTGERGSIRSPSGATGATVLNRSLLVLKEIHGDTRKYGQTGAKGGYRCSGKLRELTGAKGTNR